MTNGEYLYKNPNVLYNLIFSNFDRDSCVGCPAIEVCTSSDPNDIEDCRHGFLIWLKTQYKD